MFTTTSKIGQLLNSTKIVFAAAMLAGVSVTAFAGNKPGAVSYSYFFTGTRYFNAGNETPIKLTPAPLPTATSPIVLMGGGPDVDEAYRWMINKAGITKATGGRFVVIRTTGTDAYDPYLYYSDANNSTTTPAVDGYVGGANLGLTSAETLILTDRTAAEDPFVNAVVGSANAVWIAGGDQSTYINLWKGTKLAKTLDALISKNVPIGGTSAGANVLGQFVYSAMNGTVTSKQALSNPFNKYMTFDPTNFTDPSFLAPTGLNNIPVLINTFVDPHFDARDRMGRLVTFVSRSTTGCSGGVIPTASANLARGIGIGVETALLIQKDNNTQRYVGQRVTNPSTTTTSAIHFLTPKPSPAMTCLSGKPLSISYVNVQRYADSANPFDISSWWAGGTGAPTATNYTVGVNAGVLTPSVINY